MPYFIVRTVRVTYLKYLVEAEHEKEACDKYGRYIGYLNADKEGYKVIGGPFESVDAAMSHISSYTEGDDARDAHQ